MHEEEKIIEDVRKLYLSDNSRYNCVHLTHETFSKPVVYIPIQVCDPTIKPFNQCFGHALKTTEVKHFSLNWPTGLI